MTAEPTADRPSPTTLPSAPQVRGLFPETRIFCVEEEIYQTLERLCERLTNTYGLVAVELELALTKPPAEQTPYVESARRLSVLGTATLRKFLWQWAAVRSCEADTTTEELRS